MKRRFLLIIYACVFIFVLSQMVFAMPIEDCFVAGTKIEMADGSQKNIEDVVVGDYVKTVDTSSKTLENKLVRRTLSTFHTGVDNDITVIITFEDGVVNQNTNSHPYYVVGKGWASYDAKRTFNLYGLRVAYLKEGDTVLKLVDGVLQKEKIISIKENREPVQTYTLIDVEDNHNFFANGILVHNKGGSTSDLDDPVVTSGDDDDPPPSAEDLAEAYARANCGDGECSVSCSNSRTCSVVYVNEETAIVTTFDQDEIDARFEAAKNLDTETTDADGNPVTLAYDPDAVTTSWTFDPNTGELVVSSEAPMYDPSTIPEGYTEDDVRYNSETGQYELDVAVTSTSPDQTFEFPDQQTVTSTVTVPNPINWDWDTADPICSGADCELSEEEQNLVDQVSSCEGCSACSTADCTVSPPLEDSYIVQYDENGDPILDEDGNIEKFAYAIRNYDMDGDGKINIPPDAQTIVYDSDGNGVIDSETCGGCPGDANFNGLDGQVTQDTDVTHESTEDIIRTVTIPGTTTVSTETQALDPNAGENSATYNPITNMYEFDLGGDTVTAPVPPTTTTDPEDTGGDVDCNPHCDSSVTCETDCKVTYTRSKLSECTATFETNPELYPSCYGDECCAGIGACRVCDGIRGCDCSCSEITIPSGTPEKCNQINDNCDTSYLVDEGLIKKGPLNTLQAGVCAGTKQTCYLPAHISTTTTISWVDDYNIPNYETTEITCDGLDNDCDGAIDEGCDSDLDGFIDAGNPCTGSPLCVDDQGFRVPCRYGGTNGPACYGGYGTDCDDMMFLANPGMKEICDTFDNDCDSGVDGWSLSYFDTNPDTGRDEGCDDDSDGYADAQFGCSKKFINGTGGISSCVMTAPNGKLIPKLDCEDAPGSGNIINRYIDTVNDRVCVDGLWVDLSFR